MANPTINKLVTGPGPQQDPAESGLASCTPRPVVNTWDVFDTLLARFVERRAIFDMVEARSKASDFVKRRLAAQAALDRIGRPYTVYEIYGVMVQQNNLAPEMARKLLHDEIATERENLIPIRRNIAQVQPTDLIVSDTYLPPEMISSFLFEIGEMPAHLPVVASNWGKHSGTLWNELLKRYVIRRHFGDNPKSDVEMPRKFRIDCELISDSAPTAWEKMLHGVGLEQLARIQREVRLRCFPVDAGLVHQLICGPYLSLLLGYAVHLVRSFGFGARFGFLSRDCDDLSRIFRALFPSVNAFNIDLSRRLTRNSAFDPYFAGRITESTILVDVLSTGRSFFAFADRVGARGKAFVTLLFLECLLTPQEKRASEQRRKAGQLHYVAAIPQTISHYSFECLLQSHYPPVAAVAHDPRSGGVVRAFGTHELNQDEQAIIVWKSGAVSEFVRTFHRRGLALPNNEQNRKLIERGLNAIIRSSDVMRSFPSFIARERFNPF